MRAIAINNAICITINQPRRRPKNGSVNLSNKGAQINLKEYGIATKLNNPMAVKSTFSTVIQAFKVFPVKKNGKPDDEPNNNKAAILRLLKTCSNDEIVCTVLFVSPKVEEFERYCHIDGVICGKDAYK
jgi:hypothetical protein